VALVSLLAVLVAVGVVVVYVAVQAQVAAGIVVVFVVVQVQAVVVILADGALHASP